MEKQLIELQARLGDISARMEDIMSKKGEMLTDEIEAEFNSLDSEKVGLEKKAGMLEKAMAAKKASEDASNIDVPKYQRQIKPEQIVDPLANNKLPATVRKWGKMKCFTDEPDMRAEVKAYRFGQYIRGAVIGSEKARQWCQTNGIEIKGAMLEDNNSKGGYLVPGEFDTDIIRLVEERGVFRVNTRVTPMGQDTLSFSRRTGGTTAYFVGEATALTASDMTFDLVTLVAKKLGVIVPMSNELGDDAIVSVADMLAQDIAYAFADKEDECGFNGDGTSTYGGVVGVRQQLIDQAFNGTASDADATRAAAAGLVRYGTGQEFSNIGMDDITALIGRLPTYAEAGAKFYMSKIVWSYLLDMLADAGGNTMQTLASGPAGREFLGYPVVISSVMPKTDTAVNQVCILLGDLRQAATFGDRHRNSMAMSDSAYVGSSSMFETDQIAIRGIERFDINVHDVGSDTAPGPVVGLISHTS